MKLAYHKVISMYICVLCGIELIIAWIPKNNGAWPSSDQKILFIYNGIVYSFESLFDNRLHFDDGKVVVFSDLIYFGRVYLVSHAWILP